MIEQAQSIFILGIKGVAMANIALILKKMGKDVVGSDTAEQFITDELLQANDIEVITSFDPGALPDTIDLFVYSAAHNGLYNLQALEAQKRGIKIISQAEFLGELLKEFKNSIAICGCHGKTTTTSLMAYTLKELNKHPSYLVGTSTFGEYWGGEYDSKDYFAIEADEYGIYPPVDTTPKFHFLHPTHILCTNIDFDHPDVYQNIEDTKRAFLKFFTQNQNARLFLCADNKELMEVAVQLPHQRYETYGFKNEADMHISKAFIGESHCSFELTYKGRALGVFTISLFGFHNIANAAGVVLTLMNLGFSPDEIKKAMVEFSGARRRFEKIFHENDIYLFDDYGHHPAEIQATILSARERFKGKRVIVIFQPHTYSRTSSLKYEFIKALSLADLAFISPVFASAREDRKDTIFTSNDLLEIARAEKISTIFTYNSSEELMGLLYEKVQRGDVIFTIGAGDIYKLKDDIIKVVRQK